MKEQFKHYLYSFNWIFFYELFILILSNKYGGKTLMIIIFARWISCNFFTSSSHGGYNRKIVQTNLSYGAGFFWILWQQQKKNKMHSRPLWFRQTDIFYDKYNIKILQYIRPTTRRDVLVIYSFLEPLYRFN